MAVGLLVDGAIVVTELADRRMAEGEIAPGCLLGGRAAHVLADHRLDLHDARGVRAAGVLARHSRASS